MIMLFINKYEHHKPKQKNIKQIITSGRGSGADVFTGEGRL